MKVRIVLAGNGPETQKPGAVGLRVTALASMDQRITGFGLAVKGIFRSLLVPSFGVRFLGLALAIQLRETNAIF